MDKIDVKALEIRDYAISQGWALVKEALKDGLFVLNSPTNDFTQLIFPKDDSISEYQEMAMVSIRRLTEFYKLPLNKVVEDIREVNDDVIALRYFSDSKTVNSISFQEALDSIDATKQMLLSAASTIVNPVTFHPKLNRTEAQDLIKKARFRHTEEGSFILKVSIPFELTHAPVTSLFGDVLETPFSRKAIEVVSQSSNILLDTIESDSINELYQNQSTVENPLISYNFCDAVSKLFDEERELPFQLIFNWSKASLMKLPAPALPQRITFPFSHKNKIEEIREYFTPKRNDLQDDFIATVETLDGSIGEDGKRSGPVVLSILYENEIIKAKVNLNSDAYTVAVEAHKKGGSYVEINGLLKRNKRSNTIEEIKSFKLRGG
ncbi:MAG TPA: hypothetical protein PLQ57_05215 [Saprospiraceae bacterium]|nr:hypothetical protein [Saprospiraceae bacterium]